MEDVKQLIKDAIREKEDEESTEWFFGVIFIIIFMGLIHWIFH